MKQWEKDFDKLFVEQGSHRGGKVVRQEAGKIIDFIKETREQAKKEERDRILKYLYTQIQDDYIECSIDYFLKDQALIMGIDL
jgi:hypothetical protein